MLLLLLGFLCAEGGEVRGLSDLEWKEQMFFLLAGVFFYSFNCKMEDLREMKPMVCFLLMMIYCSNSNKKLRESLAVIY